MNPPPATLEAGSSPSPGSPAPRDSADRPFFVVNALVSAGALSLLGWLLLVHSHAAGGAATGRGTAAAAPGGLDLSYLPAVNATLNGTTAVLLLVGRLAIAQKRTRAHRSLMLSAFVASALFFLSYIAYHYTHGDTRFVGSPAVKGIYLTILITHVLLSMTVVPLALSAIWFAFRRNFASHVKVTKILWPIWMYVAVTGVVIYLFLRSQY